LGGGRAQKNGQLDNTLIVFTSDNGGERFSDNWPLVGGKMDLTEGGIRVPWIAMQRFLTFRQWPRLTAPLARTEVLAGLTVALVMIPQAVAYAGLAGMPWSPGFTPA
jgi:hypothetical protein